MCHGWCEVLRRAQWLELHALWREYMCLHDGRMVGLQSADVCAFLQVACVHTVEGLGWAAERWRFGVWGLGLPSLLHVLYYIRVDGVCVTLYLVYAAWETWHGMACNDHCRIAAGVVPLSVRWTCCAWPGVHIINILYTLAGVTFPLGGSLYMRYHVWCMFVRVMMTQLSAAHCMPLGAACKQRNMHLNQEQRCLHGQGQPANACSHPLLLFPVHVVLWHASNVCLALHPLLTNRSQAFGSCNA